MARTSMLLTVAVLLLFFAPQLSSTKSVSLPKRAQCDLPPTYEISGATFNSSCNRVWAGHDLAIFFGATIYDCLQECANWNQNAQHQQQCVGIAWSTDKPGPTAGTHVCYLKWDISGNFTDNVPDYSGQLQGVTKVTTVYIQISTFF